MGTQLSVNGVCLHREKFAVLVGSNIGPHQGPRSNDHCLWATVSRGAATDARDIPVDLGVRVLVKGMG